MTDLIQSQLRIIFIMGYCGLTSGLIIDVFSLFIKRFLKGHKICTAAAKIFCAIVIAFLAGEFVFYCQNGKLSFCVWAAFFAGLWLWRKFFYGIIDAND